MCVSPDLQLICHDGCETTVTVTHDRRTMIVPVFGQEVQSVTYESSVGIWCAETSEFKFMCRWLIIATGENAVPAIPDIAGLGDFRGRLLHSSSYTNGAEFKGSKILVVGCGNSGMEVSLDLCNSGAQVSLVVRDKVTHLDLMP